MKIFANTYIQFLCAFFISFFVYISDPLFQSLGDPRPNMELALSLAQKPFNLPIVTPEEHPWAFIWNLKISEDHLFSGSFANWENTIGNKSLSIWKKEGKLQMKKNNYFVVPTQRPEEFASTFGPSTPLATAPLAWAALKLFPEILFQQELKVLIFRWISSILVALAVAFFFLSIRVFLSSYSYWYSIVLLMLFAFGSSAWRGKRQPWIPVFTLSVTHIS